MFRPQQFQWDAIRQVLEAGFSVTIDEQFHTAIDRGYVATGLVTGDRYVLNRVGTQYHWVYQTVQEAP